MGWKHAWLAAAVLATGAAAAAFATPDRVTEDAAAFEARILGDKTPGRPRNCIMASQVRGSKFIGERTIIYQVNRDLVYRNDPPNGCPGLRENSTLITQSPQNQLCRGDVVIVRDLVTGFNGSSCALGQFVPYVTK
jgi:hypothetical protein